MSHIHNIIARCSKANLLHNLQIISAQMPDSAVVPVIKGNAYGHDILKVAHLLKEKISTFAVYSLLEGIALRESNICNRILILQGCMTAEELQIAYDNHFDIVIHNKHTLNLFLAHRTTQQLTIWLELNIGLNRLGFAEEPFLHAYQKLWQEARIEEIVLMCHGINPKTKNDSKHKEMLSVFQKQVESLKHQFPKLANKVKTSLHSSIGTFFSPDIPSDYIRVGHFLYGIPLQNINPKDFNLRSVMTIESRIIEIRTVESGSCIDYSGNCVYEKTRIAVLGIGYSDGSIVSLLKNTQIYINNKLAQVLSIFMNLICISIPDGVDLKVGDFVSFCTSHESAKHQEGNVITGLSASPYFANLNPSIPRIYD